MDQHFFKINIYNFYTYRKAYRDAMAHAGTGPALMAMKKWIQSGKVEGEEAAELLAVLPNTARYPTREYVNEFFVRMPLNINYNYVKKPLSQASVAQCITHQLCTRVNPSLILMRNTKRRLHFTNALSFLKKWETTPKK